MVEPEAQKEEDVVKPLFEVGKEYMTSNGRKARILSYHPEQLKPYIGEFWDTNEKCYPMNWHPNGNTVSNWPRGTDLVPPEPEIEISDAVFAAFFLNKNLDRQIKKENAPNTVRSLKAVIKAYLAEQKEVGKKDIV